MAKKVLFLSLVVLLLGVGLLAYWKYVLGWAIFEESMRDVRARYSPRFAEVREQLKRLVGKLPPPGKMPESVGPIKLDPPLGHDAKTRRPNYTVAMDYECLNPDDTSHVYPGDPSKFWITFGGPEGLVSVTRSMGDGLPLSDSALRRPGQFMAERSETTLAIPYLVICRAVSFVGPTIQTEQRTFLPAKVDLEAFVIDLRDDALKACVRVKAQNVAEKLSVVMDRAKGHAVQQLTHELQQLVGQETERKLKMLGSKNP